MLKALFKEKFALPLEEVKRRHEYADSKYVDIQGMQVHYRDVGEGPTLLLLHGMFSSLHTWEDWIEILKNDFRIIAVDAPNYGFTGAHPDGMFKHIYSNFLNDFTDALEITECMIAGNSLGGWMAWEFAGRFPSKVKKLILIDSAGFFFVVPLLLMMMALPFSTSISPLVRYPKSVFRATLSQVYGDPSRLSKAKLNLYYDLMMRKGNRASGARVIHYIRNMGGFRNGYMKKIKQPTLIMWGEEDRWIPKRHVPMFCKAIKNSESIIYPGLGHMPMEEMPEITAKDARKFLLAN